MTLAALLSPYDHVILDLDGCVWVAETATRDAPEAVAALRGAGKTVTFLTNGNRSSPEDYVRKLWSLGIQAGLEEVVTAGAALQYELAGRADGAGAFVIGAPAIFRHVSEAGQRILNGSERASGAEVVVISDHENLGYAELRTATRAVLAGAEMLATSRDRTFPGAGGFSPGTGAIVAALEYATGTDARCVGKPEPQMFDTALDRLGPGRVLVVGDRLDSDLAGAAAAGLDGAIVLTGASTREQALAAGEPAPVAVADDLHALLLGR